MNKDTSNYVDARTPEERANEPESFVTTATALNKDTLKERAEEAKNWHTEWYEGSTGISIDDFLYQKALSLIEQTRKEERERIVDIIEKEFETQEIDGIKTGRLSVGKDWFRNIIDKIY